MKTIQKISNYEDQGLDGFNTRNTMKGNEQQVVALIGAMKKQLQTSKYLQRAKGRSTPLYQVMRDDLKR